MRCDGPFDQTASPPKHQPRLRADGSPLRVAAVHRVALHTLPLPGPPCQEPGSPCPNSTPPQPKRARRRPLSAASRRRRAAQINQNVNNCGAASTAAAFDPTPLPPGGKHFSWFVPTRLL